MKSSNQEMLKAFNNFESVVAGNGLECPLTDREIEVLRLAAAGKSARVIGTLLKLSHKTVERHKANMMQKLRLRTTVDLTRYAIRNGFIEA